MTDVGDRAVRIRTVGLALTGFLVLLAAASAYGSTVYSESGTSCNSLAVGIQRSPEDAFCSAQAEPRRTLVAALAVTGLLLLAAAAVPARRHAPTYASVDQGVPPSYGLALFGLLTPLASGCLLLMSLILVPPQGQIYLGLPDGWKHLTSAGAVIVACAVPAVRQPHLRRWAAAAAAVAVPISLALTATVVALRKRKYLAWPDITASLTTFRDGDLSWLLPVPVTCLALVLAVLCSRHGRRPPRLGTSAALIGLAAAVSTVVFVPDLVPAWESRCCQPGVGMAPGPSTWMTLLWGCVVVSVTVTGLLALRRAGTKPHTATLDDEHPGGVPV